MQNNFFGSKLNSVLLLILIILLGFVLYFMYQEKATYLPFVEEEKKEEVKNSLDLMNQNEVKSEQVKETYTYANHGFTIELPKGFVVKEMNAGGGISIPMPNNVTLSYITDAVVWEKDAVKNFKSLGNEKIGIHTFKVFYYNKHIIYWFKQGNVGYAFWDAKDDDGLIETFKFVGWPQIEGNKEDLISFSILPNTEVRGTVSYRGEIKGGYFFEANILVAVTDINKKVIKQSNGISTTEWMTAGPVKFEGNMDFSNLPKGKAYLKISQDDPSGGESGKAVKEIFIPIIIK